MSPIQQEAFEAARKIQPLGDRVLVRLRNDMRRVGLVWLPTGGQNLDVICSEVIARGPDVKARMWELAPGDYVLHVRVVGVAYDGVLGLLGKASHDRKASDYRFLKEDEIIACVDPEAVGKIDGAAQYDEGRTGVRDTRSL